jgi:hypothetical protein
MTASIAGEIVDVVVDAEYRGEVYERTVRLETGSNTYDLYQNGGHVTEKDREKSVDLTLLAQPIVDVAVCLDEMKEIVQPDEHAGELSRWHTILTGKIVEITPDIGSSQDDQREYLLLDVGHGTVLIAMDEKLEKLITSGKIDVGSYIQVTSGRVDIVGRKGEK